MPTKTVENYVKQILMQQYLAPAELVSLGALATRMKVVPGTITTMVKGLSPTSRIRGRIRVLRRANPS